MVRAFVGTSGWMYRNWREGWYGKVPMRRWLAFCAERFSSVEIDGTFYGSKPASVYAKWANETPPGFVFAVRGHRFVTHRKRLKDVRASVVRLCEEAQGLGDKLGPILWQTPPSMQCDLDRLKSFVDDLAACPAARHALEFRHSSWFIPEVRKVLQDAGHAITVSDGEGIPLWKDVSADFTFVRLHGRPHRYYSNYEEPQLQAWTEWIKSQSVNAAYVYFDNDAANFAPHNAVRSLELFGTRPANNALPL